MADTASLVVRVSGEGIDATNKSLDKFTATSSKAEKATNSFSNASEKASRPVGAFGSKAQQAGYQIQDMVVQLQGGTSAFVAIGQQVPQFLGAFGAFGAITGTVVALGAAIGGVLYKSMGSATISAEQLKDANKSLGDVLETTDIGVLQLTDSITKLAAANEAAASAKIASALADAQVRIDAAKQSADDAATSVDSFFSAFNAAGTIQNAAIELEAFRAAGNTTQDALAALSDETTATYKNLGATSNYVSNLTDEFNINRGQALQLVDALSGISSAKTPEEMQRIANQVSEVTKQTNYANPELNRLNQTLQQAALDMVSGADAAEVLKKALASMGDVAKTAGADVRASVDLQLQALKAQTLSGAEQIKAQAELKKKQLSQNKDYTEADLKQANEYIDQAASNEINALNQREALRDQKHSVSIAKQDKRDAERLQRQKDAAQKFLDETKQGGMNELDAIDAKETEKLTKLNDYHNRDLINEQQYQDGKLAIQQEANKKREDLLIQQLEKEQQQRDQYQKFIDPINQDGMSEIAVIEAQQEEELRTLQDYKNKKIINEQEYADAVRKIQEQTERKKNDVYLDGLSTMTDNLRSALGENSALYKAAAITQTIIDTYKGAQAAFTSLATIPVVGTALGTAAAAAAIGSGMARVAAIKSAREQGGYMTGGSAYQMAERGKAEVIVPAGQSRARTVSQMQQMMGQSSSGIKGVTIVNNTTGRIDNATTEVDNEGMLRVLIDEHVSSQLMTQDSPIAKARRSTAGQPGY